MSVFLLPSFTATIAAIAVKSGELLEPACRKFSFLLLRLRQERKGKLRKFSVNDQLISNFEDYRRYKKADVVKRHYMHTGRSLLLLLFTRPLPRDGGMAEDHGAPEAGQLPRVWTRGHKETESRQRVSGAKSP